MTDATVPLTRMNQGREEHRVKTLWSGINHHHAIGGILQTPRLGVGQSLINAMAQDRQSAQNLATEVGRTKGLMGDIEIEMTMRTEEPHPRVRNTEEDRPGNRNPHGSAV